MEYTKTPANTKELKGFLQDYLRQKGIHLTKPFRCLNPEHPDRNPSMSYNKKNATVHCFACGANYDLFDLIGIDYGLNRFQDQYRKICELFGCAVPDFPPAPPAVPVHLHTKRANLQWEAIDETAEQTADRAEEMIGLRQNANEEYPYLSGRGIGRQLCQSYCLFETNERAFFPITEDGVCTSWCARAVGQGVQPRYLNSKGSLGVWNGDILKTNGADAALFITEGIIDALSIESLGYRAIALCGSQSSGKLLKLCADHAQTAMTYRFILCGDNDDAGHRMNQQLTQGLQKQGLRCTSVSPPMQGDWNENYLHSAETLAAALKSISETADQIRLAADAKELLTEFFQAAEQKQLCIPTGFNQLDCILDGGIYPGLYVIGSVSSAGKTSLILQMADSIAERGNDVLFFSLEQDKFELIAKSLSRISAQIERPFYKNAFTSRSFLNLGSRTARENPERNTVLQMTRTVYESIGPHLFFYEGMGDIGAQDIRGIVKDHCSVRGGCPVVMIDYLQILKPEEPGATDKRNTDRAVIDLKKLSRDFHLPVIAVSSFNRENYRNTVSMESFKESGAVEYCSDVLMGIQLAGTGEQGFDSNREKNRQPRQIELVVLKNRNGVPYAKIPLNYDSRFSLFE